MLAQNKDEPIRLLPLPDVAPMLGISLNTLRQWAFQHRIPTVRLGRRVLVPEQELRAFIEQRKTPVKRDDAVQSN